MSTTRARAWTAAQALAAALRAHDADETSGRQWRRKPQECPWWCASDHRCTARLGYPSGQHRSEPITWPTPYGSLVATRAQTLSGAPYLELRASVRLSTVEDTARWQGQHLPVGVDLTIRAVTNAAAISSENQSQELRGVAGPSRSRPLLPPTPGDPAKPARPATSVRPNACPSRPGQGQEPTRSRLQRPALG